MRIDSPPIVDKTIFGGIVAWFTETVATLAVAGGTSSRPKRDNSKLKNKRL
ncbi:MAG: hypothetical protein ABR566_16755 [Pyrinomonadaceae bacterium]